LRGRDIGDRKPVRFIKQVSRCCLRFSGHGVVDDKKGFQGARKRPPGEANKDLGLRLFQKEISAVWGFPLICFHGGIIKNLFQQKAALRAAEVNSQAIYKITSFNVSRHL
jgi:hypothetical protein